MSNLQGYIPIGEASKRLNQNRDMLSAWVNRWNKKAPFTVRRLPGFIHENDLLRAHKIRETYDLRNYFSHGLLIKKGIV